MKKKELEEKLAMITDIALMLQEKLSLEAFENRRLEQELKQGQENYDKLWDMYSELKKENTVNDKLTFKVGDWCWYQGGHLMQIIDIDEDDSVVAKSVSPIVNKVFFKGFEHCELFVGKLPSSIKGE